MNKEIKTIENENGKWCSVEVESNKLKEQLELANSIIKLFMKGGPRKIINLRSDGYGAYYIAVEIENVQEQRLFLNMESKWKSIQYDYLKELLENGNK